MGGESHISRAMGNPLAKRRRLAAVPLKATWPASPHPASHLLLALGRAGWPGSLECAWDTEPGDVEPFAAVLLAGSGSGLGGSPWRRSAPQRALRLARIGRGMGNAGG